MARKEIKHMPTTQQFRFDAQGCDETADLAEYVAEQVQEDDDFIAAATQDVRKHDPRAVYVDDSFSVESVVIAENGEVHLTYGYDWEAHYGCSDMCQSDTETETLIGHIIDGEVAFAIVHHEDRSTADEL